jgi:selenocysteine lyase/cysteine desulfurase
MAAAPVAAQAALAKPLGAAAPLPDRSAFDLGDTTYLDSGTMHPVSVGGKAAVDAYLQRRMFRSGSSSLGLDEAGTLAKFAKLVNADADEVAFVQSTTAGEQLVLHALGLPARGAHIVTDTLHFFGSFPLYEGLAEQGCEVTWLRPKDGRILLEDMDRAVRKGTRLVALSLVSTYNGFEHDLKAVCDIAHGRGALVYADIVHAAGCVPVDLHGSGVDFAACASYKWLMGDFGLGFVYTRRDRQEMLRRTQWGYYGIGDFQSHVYPLDPPGTSAGREIADYRFFPNASGHFAFGTYSHMGVALVDHSIDYIQSLGVERIQAHVSQLCQRLKGELPRRGYVLATPRETRTPLVAFTLDNARDRLKPRLDTADVRIMTAKNRFRVAPSVFNTMDDIERLLAALP